MKKTALTQLKKTDYPFGNSFAGLARRAFALLLVFLTVISTGCSQAALSGSDKEVIEAYELRVDGKVDQAHEMLLGILEKDSANAMAWYELSRLKEYMMLSGGAPEMEEINRMADRALQYDQGNVIYAYKVAMDAFLSAYIAMHGDPQNVGGYVSVACDKYKKVLEIKPDYLEAMLYLVEIYGMLPPEMGGDSMQAESYAQKLEAMDDYFGAKARLDLMGEDVSMVDYWNKYLEKHERNAVILKELGRAYLYQEDPERAFQYFQEAIKLDPSQTILLLDMARYHQMLVMQNRDLAAQELPKSKIYIDQYLASDPGPIIPLRAYAIGMLAKVAMFTGQKEEADKLMEGAKSLDPYFSRAFGVPSPNLFIPPNEVSHHFGSFFMPF